MATKTTETKAATKKCATKKACSTKASAPKACATKKTCAKTSAPKKTCATKKTCAKKADETKVATKKCASKRTCTRKTATKKSAINKELSESKLTMVIAKCDIGWGNVLYIRGQGAELSWDKGIAMQSVSDNEWLWEVKGIEGELEFKFLVNDEIWCDGENISGKANEIHTYYPEF